MDSGTALLDSAAFSCGSLLIRIDRIKGKFISIANRRDLDFSMFWGNL